MADADATGETVQASSSKDPSSFLSEIHGAPITVKLNSGVEYKGELQSVDGYMNIALENTEEYVNGERKNRYGDVFIRGNNVLYISADK
ncbi:U4/U6-U5 snRNP complex subunit lsm6 [Arthrobotrys musiformis]|uniref:U6 snRNA-associated Sm-like protein LSm6 n=1 Tax=Arthrobotrys musiformis TaxID=47236 RepID=A0AAV9VWI7_9PEZI